MGNLTLLQYISVVVYDLYNFKRNKAISRDVLVKQILFTGYEALQITALISLIMGAAIIKEGYTFLGQLGQTDWIYRILVSTILRDIGPMIVAFIILARSGTAISTELGNMVVNKEIDALKAMGISPISYIVSPRVIGMIVSLLILIIYFVIIGLFGGYIVSNFFNPLPFAEFFSRFINILSIMDLVTMVLKTAFSGFFISVICSYHGLSVKRATTEVPQRNIKAVINSLIAVFIVNVVVTIFHVLVVGF